MTDAVSPRMRLEQEIGQCFHNLELAIDKNLLSKPQAKDCLVMAVRAAYDRVLEAIDHYAPPPEPESLSRDTSMDGARWYASGGDLSRAGPFPTQKQAWLAMRLTPEARAKEECPYPKDTLVWPEWD